MPGGTQETHSHVFRHGWRRDYSFAQTFPKFEHPYIGNALADRSEELFDLIILERVQLR